MSTVRYIGDEPREVSILPAGFLRLVQPDQTFEVPDKYDGAYACQPHYYEVPGYDPPEAAPDVELSVPEIEIDGEPIDKPTTTEKKAGK